MPIRTEIALSAGQSRVVVMVALLASTCVTVLAIFTVGESRAVVQFGEALIQHWHATTTRLALNVSGTL